MEEGDSRLPSCQACRRKKIKVRMLSKGFVHFTSDNDWDSATRTSQDVQLVSRRRQNAYSKISSLPKSTLASVYIFCHIVSSWNRADLKNREIAQLEQRERNLRASLEEHNVLTLESSTSPAASRHRGRRFVGDEVGLK